MSTLRERLTPEEFAEYRRVAARRSYVKHREKNIARVLAYHAAHPEVHKAAVARYVKRHPEKRAEWTQRWRDRNPERYKAATLKRTKARWAANPGLRRVGVQKRRARRRNAQIEPITLADWTLLCEQYAYLCAYCGRGDAPLTQDHIAPLSRGGAHAVENIVPACFSCNAKKHAMTLLKFLLKRRT